MAVLQTQVHLTRAHLALANDPTTQVVSGTTDRDENLVQEGAFRNYANGVTRLILGTATQQTNGFTLRALNPDQVAMVESMKGKTCVFRDTYGRKVFGSFLTLRKKDIAHSGTPGKNTLLTDVTLTFVTVSYSEGV